MSKKIEEINEEVVEEVADEVEITEEPKKSVLSKIGSFAKKHGKKVLVAGLIGGAFILGNKASKKGSNIETYDDLESEDHNVDSDVE